MKTNDTKETRSQHEIIENIILGQQESIEEETSITPEQEEEIVLEFLQGILGNALNEGTEEEKEHAIIEAVTNLNVVTAVVNNYFGLDWKPIASFFWASPRVPGSDWSGNSTFLTANKNFSLSVISNPWLLG